MQGIEHFISARYCLGMTETPPPLEDIANQLQFLTEKLKQANDVNERRALLTQFRALLKQADTLNQG